MNQPYNSREVGLIENDIDTIQHKSSKIDFNHHRTESCVEKEDLMNQTPPLGT